MLLPPVPQLLVARARRRSLPSAPALVMLCVLAGLALGAGVAPVWAQDAGSDAEETEEEEEQPKPAADTAVATAERESYLRKLIDALSSDDSFKVRLQAAVLLGRSDDESAVGPLINALNADAHYTVRAAAATALANLDELKALSHILKAAAVDPEAFVREEAQRALGKYDREDALPFVVATYNGSEDPAIRKEAVEYLIVDLLPRAEPVLDRALGDVPAIFEISKAAVLRMERERAMRLLQGAIEHREPAVRRGAVQVLHELGTPEATRLILSVYERDIEVEEVRNATRDALRSRRAQLPMDQIVKDATSSAEKYTRARALKLLGVVGGDHAEQVLVAALNDNEIYIRGNAVMALQWLGSPTVVPTLERLAADPANQRIMLQIRSVLKALREKDSKK